MLLAFGVDRFASRNPRIYVARTSSTPAQRASDVIELEPQFHQDNDVPDSDLSDADSDHAADAQVDLEVLPVLSDRMHVLWLTSVSPRISSEATTRGCFPRMASRRVWIRHSLTPTTSMMAARS